MDMEEIKVTLEEKVSSNIGKGVQNRSQSLQLYALPPPQLLHDHIKLSFSVLFNAI